MAVLKKKQRTQSRVTPPAKKKGVTTSKRSVLMPKKTVAKPKKAVVTPKKAVTKPKTAGIGPQKAVAQQKVVIPVSSKPTAQTCPLVLDGIVIEVDFSPRDCFSCDEFDCRFYAAEERSGPLGSRLFRGEESDEEGDDFELLDGDEEEPEGEDGWGDEDDQ